MNVLELIKRAKRKEAKLQEAGLANAKVTYRGVTYQQAAKQALCPDCGHKIQVKPKTEYKYRGQAYVS